MATMKSFPFKGSPAGTHITPCMEVEKETVDKKSILNMLTREDMVGRVRRCTGYSRPSPYGSGPGSVAPS